MTHRSADPLDELHDADPVHSAPAPSASRARVWARLQEVTMDRPVSPRRTPAALTLGLAGLAAAGVLAVSVFVRPGATPAPSEQPGPGIGSCVETYSLETLGNRDFAFDGTVSVIDGDAVTFAVNETFSGALAEAVTLTAAGMTGTSTTSGGGPALAEGERYLVAGDDTFVWGCGFTQAYDAGVADDWREATR